MTRQQPKICVKKRWNVWQTSKRKKGGDDSESTKKRSPRSTAEAVEYLKGRAAKEIVLKKQELE